MKTLLILAVLLSVGIGSVYHANAQEPKQIVTVKYEFEPVPLAEKYAAMLGVDSRNVRVTTENDNVTVEVLNVIPSDDSALLDYASENGLRLKE